MSAPGVGAPPGMQQANSPQPGRPGGFPPNFQPPANMPNINFSAPVIRLGTTGPNKPTSAIGESGAREGRGDARGGRAGLGASDGARGGRDNLAVLVPPTKDEVLRTIFVGGITEGAGGDDGIERILRSAGNLRRWSRALDADDKACRFGFAEYEDPDSLSTAIDVLKNVEVPVKPQSVKEGGGGEDDEAVEKSALLVSLRCSVRSLTFTHVALQGRRG